MADLNVRPVVRTAHGLMNSDPQRALATIDEALAEEPNDPQAHYVRGLILAFHLDRPADGRVNLELAYKAVVENQYFVPGAHRAYATCLAALGDTVTARTVLDGCLQLYPDELDAYIERAEIGKTEGDWKAAIADLQHVIDRQPRHPIALYNRACYLALSGETDAALEALEAALEAVPEDRVTARGDEDFRTLRANPRFVSLTR